MTKPKLNSWQDVHQEVLRRIRSRDWAQGELIPNESDLAVEFGCARSTVNRALRAAADAGLLERKRKAGTRVALQPVHKATLNISILRKEIEDQNKTYSYALTSCKRKKPPAQIRAEMKLAIDTKALHVQALHLANGKPYVYEDRWINCDLLPDVLKVDFETDNANEWLLAHAPFTAGNMSFSAINATKSQATLLNTEVDAALFTVSRNTWSEETSITWVRLYYAPGFHVNFSI